MRQAVGLSGRAIAGDRHRALSVEMRGGFIGVEMREYRRELLPAMELLGRLRGAAVHEDDEMRVAGEQSHLALGVATVCAMGVGVDEFADGEPIRSLFRRNSSVGRHVGSL